MIYLVSNNVFTYNNGPEFSQFERLKAFNQNHLPTKLVLMQYSPFFSYNLNRHQIDQQDVINMYDYFQGNVGRTGEPLSIHQLANFDYSYYHLEGVDPDHSIFTFYDTKYGTVNIAPSSICKVGDEEYLDQNKKVRTRITWDRRGFVSRVDSYHLDGQLGTSRFLRSDGSTAILVTRMNKDDKVQPTMWKLLDYHGHNYVFDSEIDLFTFFLNELNRKESGTFIIDRPNLERAVLRVKGAKKISYLHDIPVDDPQNVQSSSLASSRQSTFDPGHQQKEHFDYLVFATKAERDQFEAKLSAVVPESQFEVANDSYVSVVGHTHKMNRRHPIFVYRGMLDDERGIWEVVQAFVEIHHNIEGATLKLQGFIGNDKDMDRLKSQLKSLKLDQAVDFLPYSPTNDLSVLDDATIFLNATASEAFGMNMLEAMSRGVPVVSYNGHYLTDQLLTNDKNGLVIKSNTPDSLARAALSLLSHERYYDRLAKGALTTASQYSEQSMLKQWREILK